ncbi:MAG: peptide ABC transporter substrate-binding protein, partial [Paracoccaceae bacterium]
MNILSRRSLLKVSTASLMLSAMPLPILAQEIEELVIAYNVNLPSWNPTIGVSAVNPTIQGIYQSVFDLFIAQNTDLSQTAGLLTDWGWNDDKTKIFMAVREGVV